MRGNSVLVLVTVVVLAAASQAVGADRIFWAQQTSGADRISHSEPNGANPTLVTDWPTVSNVAAIAVDSSASKVYWISATTGDDAVLCADLNGLNATTLVSWPAVSNPVGIAVDPVGGWIFWAESASGADRIKRANLDGTNVVTIVSWPDVVEPVAITFDKASNRVYFAEGGFGLERIVRVDPSGAGSTTIVSWPEISDPVAISVDSATGRVFWIEASFGDDALRSVSILGGAVDTPVSWPVISDPTSVVVDGDAGVVYWTESSLADARIVRATTAGMSVTTLLAAPIIIDPVSIALEIVDRCANSLDCDDLDACTNDACDLSTGLCSNTPIVCPPGFTCIDGTCTSSCLVDADCDDGVLCTVDTCNQGTCRNVADDSLCATGLFCNAQMCDPLAGCVPTVPCLPQPGNPCIDPSLCDETTDTCGGCFAPTVVAAGPRYLSITPADQSGESVALWVTGDCGDASTACVDKYVQSNCLGGLRDGLSCATDADCPKACATPPNAGQPCFSSSDCNGGACDGVCDSGSLGDTPVFLTPAQWGAVSVRGNAIRPETSYAVYTVCNFGGVTIRSAATSARTRRWADTNGDGIVNVTDVTTTVDGVKNLFSPFITFEGTNVWPCDPGFRVDVIDITATVDAVKGIPLACAPVCP